MSSSSSSNQAKGTHHIRNSSRERHHHHGVGSGTHASGSSSTSNMPLQEQRLPQQPTPEHPYVQKPRHRYQHRDKHSFSEGSTGNSEERGRSKTRGGTLKADENVDRRSPPMDTVPTQSCSMESAPSSEMSEAGTEIIIPQRWQAGGPPYAAHSFKAGSHTFTVDTKYNLIRVIGSGAYGVVISSLDTSTNTKVAIKMVPKAFNDEIDAKRILREIKLLKHFRHENIIGIVDMMPPLVRNVEDFHDVYIVADLMETDLHRIIYSKQSLTVDHVQYFIYQILRALKYIHSANVLHRDLKPSNLLVNSNCDLKICDLGLARGVLPDDEDINSQVGGSMLLTEYVVTRWYRAPEIMLACHEYTKPIDVWSVGCIFAELLARKPYFPGEDYIDQLTIISEKLGKVSEEDLDFVTSEKAKRFMRRLPDKSPQPLSRQFPNTPPDALDLLQRMLTVHPRKRITVSDALKHPFLAALHSPDDEPVADRPFDFGFEDDDLHRVRLQELIWEEIGSFRPGCMPVPPRKDGTRAPTRKTARRLHHV